MEVGVSSQIVISHAADSLGKEALIELMVVGGAVELMAPATLTYYAIQIGFLQGHFCFPVCFLPWSEF